MDEDGVVVLEGRHGDLTWRVRASGDDRAFTTMLHVYRDGRLVAASGMGGPKLYPGELIKWAIHPSALT